MRRLHGIRKARRVGGPSEFPTPLWPGVTSLKISALAAAPPASRNSGSFSRRRQRRFFVVSGVTSLAYRYELRRGDEIVSTGHLTLEQSLDVGDRVAIGGHEGLVYSVEPLLAGNELRLVVQLLPDRPQPAGSASAD